MATHLSVLAWRIPWTEESGSLVHGVTRVGHDLATKPPYCLNNILRIFKFYLLIIYCWWWFSRLVMYDLCDPMNCSTPGSSILHCLLVSQFSRSVVSDSLRPHELQHARPPCPSPTPGVHPNPCPLIW